MESLITQGLALSALHRAGVQPVKDASGIRFTVLVRQREIPVCLHIHENRLALYASVGWIPDAGEAALFCNRQNRTLGDGCLVAEESGRIIFKQILYIVDETTVQEELLAALSRQSALLAAIQRILNQPMLRGTSAQELPSR